MRLDIAALRLYNQQLTNPLFERPSDVVSWFGAMQAQDFAAAKWAIAQRTKNQTETTIEQAFNKGEILRTHIMRPTWHFVTPGAIRWLLKLTSSRVQRFNGYYYRRSGLDKAIFQKSNDVIRKALQGAKQLTRGDLAVKLEEVNIPTKDLGLSYIIMQAELDGIVCSGPRRGKQFTYMLLEERVPEMRDISVDEALVELTKRYLQSHGPAQAQDFSWWSGLTLSDAKKSIALLESKLDKQERNGKTYWFIKNKKHIEQNPDDCFLIPGFDEYFIAYTDRSDVLDKDYAKQLNQGGGMVNGTVVINGKMVGGWRRTFKSKKVVVTITLFEKITAQQQKTLQEQVNRFGSYLAMPVELIIQR